MTWWLITFMMIGAGTIYTYRSAKAMGVEKHPVSVAYLNLIVNSLVAGALVVMLNLFLGG